MEDEENDKTCFCRHECLVTREKVLPETFTPIICCFTLEFLGNQGFHIGDWNDFQIRHPHPAETGRAAQEEGERGPGPATGPEWGTQTRRVRRKHVSFSMLVFEVLA